jgi:MraZ protein
LGIFLSTFINKIDAKGRVSVPASFRACLVPSAPGNSEDLQQTGMVVFRSLKHSALEGCGTNRMQQLSNSIDRLDLFSETQEDLVSSIFADCHLLSFDKEGRVSIPHEFMDFANLKNFVAFVGRGATFQLWNPEVFHLVQQEARARLKKNNPALRLVAEEAK